MAPIQMRSEDVSLEIEQKDIVDILELCKKEAYYASYETPEVTIAMKRVIEFMNRDYTTVVLNNNTGLLCPTYPSHIPVQMYEKDTNNSETIHEDDYDPAELYGLFKDAKKARCRERFAVPVILYKGKYILRSATLAGSCELALRDGVGKIMNAMGVGSETHEPVCTKHCCNDNNKDESGNPTPATSDCSGNAANKDDLGNDNPADKDGTGNEPDNESMFETHDRLRAADIKVLARFNVTTIADLMVENRKIKMGIPVSSSEKVDKENRYKDFTLVIIPYPGCEHFALFREKYFEGEGLKFAWDSSCDAEIHVPNVIPSLKNINWNNYRNWDLIKITQNYVKFLLRYFQEGSSGMLIHCISGWDRTPLFISMLRLSLWADGLIHQSLDHRQILWFTIAYDWYLFSHKLPERMHKGEAIFFFCFYMLKFLQDDEFSVNARRSRRSDSRSDSERTENERNDNDTLDLHDFEVLDNDESPRNSPSPTSPPRPGSGSPSTRRTSPMKRTSPIQVPNSGARRSPTGGAASSQSCASSWQIVSQTGSVGTFDNQVAQNAQNQTMRSRRLEQVRQLFYRAYFHTIGKDIDFPGNSFYRKFI